MNKKALVIVPGFRGSSDEIHFVDMARRAKPLGIETFIVDWPFWKVDMSRYSMSATIEAVNRKIAELTIKGYDIVLAGESLGGIIAVIAAAKVKLAGLVLIVTPYRFMGGDDMEERRATWEAVGYQEYVSKTTGSIVRVPYSFVEDALSFNALEYIGKIESPTSFIVGLADKSVPNRLTKLLYNKATMKNEWIEIEGMEHTYRTQPDKMELVDAKVVELAKSYLSSEA